MTDTFTDESILEDTDLPPEHDTSGDYSPEGPSLDFMDEALSNFVKRPATAVSREYKQRTAAVLNSVMSARIQRPGSGLADAAAIIAYGDAFATAAGNLADEDERARKLLTVITSPGNPYVGFAIVATSLISQLFRNHQDEAGQIKQGWRDRKKTPRAERPKVEIKIPLTKKRIFLRVPFKLKFGGVLTSQSVEPQQLVNGVFSNEKVVKELRKRGINIAAANQPR